MSKHRNARPRGGDSTAESLKGKNRELQKYIRQLHQKIRQLEKQLGLRSTLKEDEGHEEVPESKIICDNCGKGEMKEFVLEKPGGLLIFLTCELCDHRKKKK